MIREHPVIEGPIAGGDTGRPFLESIVDLADANYVEEEFFLSGAATAFSPEPGESLGADGRWHLAPQDPLDYRTRILVRRPPAERFNGTVVVEFLQEYFGCERDTNYRWNAETFLREGFAWVGASLHHEGVDSLERETFEFGEFSFATGPSLAAWDPARYASLALPSSDLCYDVLSQVGVAVGPDRASSVDPLGGLDVRQVFASGNTIAATRLRHYVNGVHPLHQVYAGFFLQDLTDEDIPLSADVQSEVTPHLRTDVDVPVIVLNTTTAAADSTVQPDGENLRFWEPAGSSHTTGAYMVRVAEATKRDVGVDTPVCPADYANTLPVQFVSGAAFVTLAAWAAGGAPAPSFPRLARNGEVPGALPDFADDGNVSGGLRTPWVDVPIARYDWRGECLGGAGRTFPFDVVELDGLYGSPAEYRRRFAAAVEAAVVAGVLLPADGEQALDDAGKVDW